MYSLSYLYQALGDNEYADRCELTAFNALPVMTTSNQWARQYVVIANQPFSHHLSGEVPFFNVGHDGIVYGLGKKLSCKYDGFTFPLLADKVVDGYWYYSMRLTHWNSFASQLASSLPA